MILKCEVCGGELEIDESISVGKCKYCESKIVIPKDMEKKGNLYNRAIFLRQNNEFDKAKDVYEDILKENNEEAEAHWGLVLSKYGIEYVDDPKSGEKIPTIHRIRNKQILEDVDYQMAVKYADIEAAYQYEKEGKRINQILMMFLEIAKSESPYDIFICYKESDDIGNRTEDSVIAQDIYRLLEKEGYKVFFARKTLETKLGHEYEPIIYAALKSATVMLVIGTQVAYFQGTWVKNEWGRFVEFKQENPSKIIIPCYKNISPYELPMEIANYQALDIGKVGFMQDLLDGVGKVLSQDVSEGNLKYENDVDKLCKNAETFLKLNQVNRAMDIYKNVIDDNPDDYRGWWGVADILSNSFTNFETENIEEIKQNMNNAITVADKEAKDKLQKVGSEFLYNYENQKKQKEEKIAAQEREIRRIQRIYDLKSEMQYLENEINRYKDQSAKIAEINEQIAKKTPVLSRYNNIIAKHKKTYFICIMPVLIVCMCMCLYYSSRYDVYVVLGVICFLPSIRLGEFCDRSSEETYNKRLKKKNQIEMYINERKDLINQINTERIAYEEMKEKKKNIENELQQLGE